MDRAISLGGTIYNTKHIVSFRKHKNPSTNRLFIVLTLSAPIHKGNDLRKPNVVNLSYDYEEDRTSDFKLLMSCFDF